MRTALLLALAACYDPEPVRPDGAVETDAGITGTGGEYWQCWFWNDEGTPLSASGPQKCAPKCANRTLLGAFTFGPGCTIGENIVCPTENMTGPASDGGACCWQTGDRVDLVPCVSP